MPRNVMLTVDRNLTDQCTPGNRIQVMGILSITKGNSKSDSNSNK
jgi:DNA replicative helicase MCM subunit Mcm2 (Cdc46/Mcm family)